MRSFFQLVPGSIMIRTFRCSTDKRIIITISSGYTASAQYDITHL